VAKAFDLAGVVPVVSSARPAEISAKEGDGFVGALVDASGQSLTDAIALCRALRQRERPVTPVLLVLERHQLDELTFREDVVDDFVVSPVDAAELAARLRHRLKRAGHEGGTALVTQGPLVLNLETYQATIAGRIMDLTYMEYELLRFLATNPERVFTRETLLNRVWGYEYYGGARTVDVHVRRLRAKLGEEHAHLIATMRSVGYRFSPTGTVGAG
jgi:two-component system, OmpR family, alkaline phosphatase synthesis response regulator PhoP